MKAAAVLLTKVIAKSLPILDIPGGQQAIEALYKSVSDVDKLKCFVQALKDNGKSITIIIDEANNYFNVDASAPTPNDSLLDSLISLKQEQKIKCNSRWYLVWFPLSNAQVK